MQDYKTYLEEIGSALKHLEELEHVYWLLDEENIRLRKELKKYGQIEYPDPRTIVNLTEIFNLKNVRVKKEVSIPGGTILNFSGILNKHIDMIFSWPERDMKKAEFSKLLINKKMYDLAKFFKERTEDARLIAVCIVLCEHRYGIKFESPAIDKVVRGKKTAYQLRWFWETLKYIEIYKKNFIFDE